MNKLVNANKLLQDIADGLKTWDRVPMCHLMVVFSDGDNSWSFSVSQAIDFIVNDIYWDERGNWSHVTGAQVLPL